MGCHGNAATHIRRPLLFVLFTREIFTSHLGEDLVRFTTNAGATEFGVVY